VPTIEILKKNKNSFKKQVFNDKKGHGLDEETGKVAKRSKFATRLSITRLRETLTTECSQKRSVVKSLQMTIARLRVTSSSPACL